MTAVPLDYNKILQLVNQLPVRQRFALVHDVLNTLEPQPMQKEPTLPRALGLLATTKEPPSDDQVDQWLDEYRTEKYG